MTLARWMITAGGLPNLSRVVQLGGLVYLCGVTPDPEGELQAQTRQVVERTDRLLALAGPDQCRLRSAQVWLANMKDFAAHDALWNAWVDPVNPPVRACVEAWPFRPGLLVEIMVIAAR